MRIVAAETRGRCVSPAAHDSPTGWVLEICLCLTASGGLALLLFCALDAEKNLLPWVVHEAYNSAAALKLYLAVQCGLISLLYVPAAVRDYLDLLDKFLKGES
jgi:hypothetical protein